MIENSNRINEDENRDRAMIIKLSVSELEKFDVERKKVKMSRPSFIMYLIEKK